jgi:large subunit ribosomal protein L10
VLKSKKTEVVQDLSKKLQRAQCNILTDFVGLKVSEMTQLRRELKGAGAELEVVKNTLLKLASEGTGTATLGDFFVGPTAIALGYQDPVELAKILTKFAKEKPDKLKIKAGVLGSSVMSEPDIVDLSKLPAREVLLARLLSAMQGTPTALVNVLAGVIRNFLYALKAIEEQKTAT